MPIWRCPERRKGNLIITFEIEFPDHRFYSFGGEHFYDETYFQSYKMTYEYLVEECPLSHVGYKLPGKV